MSIDIELSSFFSKYTDNVLAMPVEGSNIREALSDLVHRFPKLEKLLLNDEGALRQTYDLFLNGTRVYPRNMALPLKDGDKLNILYVIHGG